MASSALFEGLEFHCAKCGIALSNQVEVLCLCAVDGDGLKRLLLETGVAAEPKVDALEINHAAGDPGHAAEIAILLGEKRIGTIDAPISSGHVGAATWALALAPEDEHLDRWPIPTRKQASQR